MLNAPSAGSAIARTALALTVLVSANEVRAQAASSEGIEEIVVVTSP